MERILILSATEKSSETLHSFVTSFFPYYQIETCFYGAEGRRLLQQKTFDFILINTPLVDEFGTDIAIFADKIHNSRVNIPQLHNAMADMGNRSGHFFAYMDNERDLRASLISACLSE